jgi:hypothetical protein
MAEEIGWDDPDILDQAHSGFESHSSCSLTTVLAFHHTGMASNYEAAEEVIEKDTAEHWVSPAVRWLPRLPLRCLPRNVIVTEKERASADGMTLERFKKLRVSSDASESSSKDSPNAGTPSADTALSLCTAKSIGEGAAIVSIPSGGLDRVGLAAIDLESAFRLLCIQWLELWLHGFLWWSVSRRKDPTRWPLRQAGICIDYRVDFGGASGPNRFQRVMLIVNAYISFKIRQFDLANPLPAQALHWKALRKELQRTGVLPPGEEQTDANYSQVYLDDVGLAGGTDTVIVPSYLHHIRLGGTGSTAVDPTSGGRYIPRDSRTHVYCLIAVWCMMWLRLSVSFSKTTAATRAIILGLRVRPTDNIIDCPELKARVMLRALADLHRDVTLGNPVILDTLERLVGRLGNISQIYAAIKLWIAAGYALIRLRYRARPTRFGRRAHSSARSSCGVAVGASGSSYSFVTRRPESLR